MELIFKVTVVMLVAAASVALLRSAAAAVRHAIWLAGLASALILPLAPDAQRRGITLTVPVTIGIVETAPDPAPASVAPAVRVPWMALLWAAGSLVTAARFLRSLMHVAQVSKTARPYSRHNGIEVRVGAKVAIPFTWGVVRPVIVLPDSAIAWTAERLRLVLMHEAIHVMRRDWLAQCVAQLACIVYWFHPLVWHAAGRMRKERERACDDGVLRAGVSAVDYAGHLLEVTRGAAAQGTISAGVAIAEGNELEARMRIVLSANRNRKALSRAGALILSVAMLMLLTPLALMKLRAQGQASGLRGVVQDPSGARVPEAILLLSREGRREITYSGPDGSYAFAAVPAGGYKLTVMSAGFARWEKDVTIEADQAASLEVTLPMGRIQETVEVMGSTTRPAVAVNSAATPQRIRVGGNVQASKLLVQEKPAYPRELQDQGVEGTVMFDAVVGTGGSLLSLRAANTMVHPGLVKAATDAVSRWRFQPTLLNGQPVEVVTSIVVRYRLPQR